MDSACAAAREDAIASARRCAHNALYAARQAASKCQIKIRSMEKNQELVKALAAAERVVQDAFRKIKSTRKKAERDLKRKERSDMAETASVISSRSRTDTYVTADTPSRMLGATAAGGVPRRYDSGGMSYASYEQPSKEEIEMEEQRKKDEWKKQYEQEKKIEELTKRLEDGAKSRGCCGGDGGSCAVS